MHFSKEKLEETDHHIRRPWNLKNAILHNNISSSKMYYVCSRICNAISNRFYFVVTRSKEVKFSVTIIGQSQLEKSSFFYFCNYSLCHFCQIFDRNCTKSMNLVMFSNATEQDQIAISCNSLYKQSKAILLKT